MLKRIKGKGKEFESTHRLKRGPYCHDRLPIFPSTARASWVSKLFIYGSLAFGDACFIFYIKSFQVFRIIKLASENVRLFHPSLKFRKIFNLFSFFW